MGWWVGGWVVGWLAGWLVGWFVGWLVGWLAGWLAGWLVGWLVGWLAGWLVGWLVGWLAGLLAGWLVGWLVGLFGVVGRLPDAGVDLAEWHIYIQINRASFGDRFLPLMFQTRKKAEGSTVDLFAETFGPQPNLTAGLGEANRDVFLSVSSGQTL